MGHLLPLPKVDEPCRPAALDLLDARPAHAYCAESPLFRRMLVVALDDLAGSFAVQTKRSAANSRDDLRIDHTTRARPVDWCGPCPLDARHLHPRPMPTLLAPTSREAPRTARRFRLWVYALRGSRWSDPGANWSAQPGRALFSYRTDRDPRRRR